MNETPSTQIDSSRRILGAPVAFDLNRSDRAFLGDGWASGEALHETPESERITAVFGDFATSDFTSYAGEMDVVFIDGAHSYSYVRNDTELARRTLAPGGMIAWDDYTSIPGGLPVPQRDRRGVGLPAGSRYGDSSRVV